MRLAVLFLANNQFQVIFMEKLVEFMSSNCDRAVFELGKHCLAN